MQTLRDKVTRWMSDGQPARVLDAYDSDAKLRATVDGDAYLLLQYGDALGQFDRLAEAQLVYERALALPGASDAQKDFARSRLSWLETEWARIESVRSGLTRSLLLGAAGLGVVTACCASLWIVGRRMRREGEA